MSRTRWVLGALAVLFTAQVACTGSSVGQTCDSLCRELVQTCDYQAYPTLESCMEGCGYYESEGADVEGQLACVQAAACDTFAIVECEHAYGLE